MTAPMSKAFALGLLVMLGGCTVGPDYQRATPVAPDRWLSTASSPDSALAASPATDDVAALAQWWTWFEDPVLNALIDTALTQNLDLRAAKARVHAARSERRAAQAGYGPQVGMSMGSQRLQNPVPGIAPGLTFSLHEVGFDARWELDLFGRQRRRVEAASAATEANQAQLEAVMTVLCAEVARSYWELRAADAQLAASHEIITLEGEQERHAARLAAAGIGSRDAVLAAASSAAEQRAVLIQSELVRRNAQDQLERLLAVAPAKLEQSLLVSDAPLPQFAPRLLLTPAAVLRNRPDIQRAERELAAATALKGAAIADLYPRVSLALFFGLRNTALSELMAIASKSWSGGSSILQPLFDAGRLRAMVDVRDAEIEGALVEYERAMLVALHETESALTQWLATEHERQAFSDSLLQLETAQRLAEHRRAQGVAADQEVLMARLAAVTARAQLRRGEAAVTISTVAVLKALGAGISHDHPAMHASDTASNTSP